MSAMQLTGKTVLLTGATGGIGMPSPAACTVRAPP